MTKVVKKRYGGREKGTPNKATQDLFALCEAKGINVFEGLLEFCKHPDYNVAFNAHKECARYLYPVRKAIEMKAEIINLEEKNKKVEDLKSKLDSIIKEL